MPKPVIHPEKSKDIQKCLAGAMDICPVGVFAKDKKGKIIAANPANCIGCRACETQCEPGVIVVED